MRYKDIGIDCDFEAQGEIVADILEKTIEQVRSTKKPNHRDIQKVNEEYLRVWRNDVRSV
jgi:predicted small metal-binding protein